MIDGKEGEFEIKLGANAAAILMLTKYQKLLKKLIIKNMQRNLQMVF